MTSARAANLSQLHADVTATFSKSKGSLNFQLLINNCVALGWHSALSNV